MEKKFKVNYKIREDKGMFLIGDILENYLLYNLVDDNDNEGKRIRVRITKIEHVASNSPMDQLTPAALRAEGENSKFSGSYRIYVEGCKGEIVNHFVSGSNQAKWVKKVYENKIPGPEELPDEAA